MAAATPEEVRAVGRGVTGFDTARWEASARRGVGIGLATGDPRARRPAEWPGRNLLGFALMQARQVLASDGSAPTR